MSRRYNQYERYNDIEDYGEPDFYQEKQRRREKLKRKRNKYGDDYRDWETDRKSTRLNSSH